MLYVKGKSFLKLYKLNSCLLSSSCNKHIIHHTHSPPLSFSFLKVFCCTFWTRFLDGSQQLATHVFSRMPSSSPLSPLSPENCRLLRALSLLRLEEEASLWMDVTDIPSCEAKPLVTWRIAFTPPPSPGLLFNKGSIKLTKLSRVMEGFLIVRVMRCYVTCMTSE